MHVTDNQGYTPYGRYGTPEIVILPHSEYKDSPPSLQTVTPSWMKRFRRWQGMMGRYDIDIANKLMPHAVGGLDESGEPHLHHKHIWAKGLKLTGANILARLRGSESTCTPSCTTATPSSSRGKLTTWRGQSGQLARWYSSICRGEHHLRHEGWLWQQRPSMFKNEVKSSVMVFCHTHEDAPC